MKKASKLGYLLGLPVLVGMLSLCFMNVANGQEIVDINLPVGYTKLDYVESKGSGYIDTQYVLSNHSSVEVKAKVKGIINMTAQQLFGNKVNTQKAVVVPATNVSTARFGNQHKTTNLIANVGTYIYKINSEGIVSSGARSTKEYTWDEDAGEFQTEGSFYLFASRGSNGPSRYTRSGTRIYWVRVEEDGQLAFYGVPCMYGYDVYGIYDIIGGAFHPLIVGSADMDDDVDADVITIPIPDEDLLHRPRLHSLYLSATETEGYIKLEDGKLKILNGLIMGADVEVGMDAIYVAIGGGDGNKIEGEEVEQSGIGGGLGNVISTSYSVIGGGVGNVTTGDGVNTVAGGQNNKTASGGTVIGGQGNIAQGKGVIIGGQNNRLGGDGSMVLGSNSYGGHGSFSWNSPYSEDYSAIIVATGGVLIGTYEPITGVNLVVSGAVKIGTGATTGEVGEIRIKSGCFCGYNGQDWFLIDKTSGLGCDCAKVTCTFENTILNVGESLRVYSEPYSLNCTSGQVFCNPNGVFGDGGTYYSFCRDLGEAKCGSANGGEYETFPNEASLCTSSDAFDMVESDAAYTWSCYHADKVVNCSATRKYQCSGTNPDGGVEVGSEYYYFGYNNTSWTYKENGDLGACQWRCASGYTLKNGKCESASGTCYGNDAMFSNEYSYHIKQVSPAGGGNWPRTLYETEAEAKQHPCSYICVNGYEYLHGENRCAKCEQGKERYYDSNHNLIGCVEISDICPKGYYYSGTIHKCLAYGNCVWNSYITNVVPQHTNITDIKNARPKDGKNKVWKYVANNPTLNQCEYTCETGYVFRESNDKLGPGCSPVSCYDTVDSGFKGNITKSNPWYKDTWRSCGIFSGVYQCYNYLDKWDYVSEVASEQAFIDWVGDKKGCYYWCPEDRLCKYYGGYYQSDDNFWICYATPKDKRDYCIQKTNTPTGNDPCKGKPYSNTLRGDSQYRGNVANGITGEIQFHTYAEISGYSLHSASGCLQGCRDTTTSIIYYNDDQTKPICWTKCEDGKYFNMNAYGNPCQSCPGDTQTPDMDNAKTYDGVTNPVSCIGYCGPGYTQCDGSEDEPCTCKPTQLDSVECPEGSYKVSNSDNTQQKCISCPSEHQMVYEEGHGFYCYYINSEGCDTEHGEYYLGDDENGFQKCATCPTDTERREGDQIICNICGEGYTQVNLENNNIRCVPNNS